MKRFLRLICLLAVAALLPAALLVSRGLPADVRPYVEKKYAGWNGVLRAWVCAEWECAGGFTRWLNACAADFEKKHDGVYIEFTQVSADALQTIGEDGLRPPELLLFSPGALADPSKLAPSDAPAALRPELRAIGGGLTYPVAMGGYILAYNRALSGDAMGARAALTALPDDPAHSFSAAAVALLSDAPEGASSESVSPEAGLDLGLPANATSPGGASSPDALERFLAGDLPAMVLSQAELARLIRQQDAGRGPDWACAATGRVAYTDQLLLLGLATPSGDAAKERLALAREFGASLLNPDAQARLADIGAFSVTGARIYPDFSAYAALDTLLNSRELLVPADPWSGAAACEDLLRARAAGSLDSDSALARLRERLAG